MNRRGADDRTDRRACCGSALARPWSLGHYPVGDLLPRAESELAADLLDVALSCALRDEKASRDLAIRQSLSDKGRHLSLPPSEVARVHRMARSIATPSTPKTGT